MFKLSFLLLLLTAGCASAQIVQRAGAFSRADTLRGSNGFYRQHWDVLHYELTVEPEFSSKTIIGKNRIRFFDNGTKLMQVDLQEPMMIDSIIHSDKKLPFSREGNVYWVMLRDTAAMYKIKPGVQEIAVYFHGKPVEAIKPPWDGGWIWKKDTQGYPWMTVACQGLGASAWYPCKDIQSDEPDSGAILNIIVPDTLVGVGNGRLISSTKAGSKMIYSWKVVNPINNYNIVPYIGNYVHFHEILLGEKGALDMDYWVLEHNLEKAKKQFTDAPKMMKAFEYWMGPYPFYEDGYKLVEAPYLGMEHQSAIAYGNGFQNGYLGRDLSATGWGLKWDFIIVHESGHEWFGNNITTNDIADMWVHEGFTNYSEVLFTDYYWGKQAGNEYARGLRQNILNDKAVTGPYGVNREGSGDMYFKASNMIHMIRQVIDDDKRFRELLRGLTRNFYHSTVSANEVEAFINKASGKNFSRLFEQYLHTTQIPTLEYRINKNTIEYRWIDCVPGFDLPLKIESQSGGYRWIKPTTAWQKFSAKKCNDGTIKVDPDFYIHVSRVN